MDDGAIITNPCKIKSAASPKPATPARALTADEVIEIARQMPARYRALVMLLGFGGLRFGEAIALRRRDVTTRGALVRVERSVRYINGEWVVGPPKTDAGRRTVALPAFVAEAVQNQLTQYAHDGPDALVFGTRTGGYVAGSNFGRTFARAVARCGLPPPARVHWLRHTGATLAASTGATKGIDAQVGTCVVERCTRLPARCEIPRQREIARAPNALVSP